MTFDQSQDMVRLERDGVGLFLAEHDGAGSPAVLVHGWCCDHGFMTPQFEHFADLGHRVVSVELRGHGRSDRPVQGYAIADFADDVVWLAEQLGIGKPLIVGHSMGGNIAFDIAARYPDFPSAIVMIDSAVARPAPSRVAASHMVDALRGEDFAEVLRLFVDKGLFLPTDTPALKREILDRMAGTAQHVVVAAMEGLRDHDPDIARGRLVVPSLYIAADELPALRHGSA